MKFIFKDIGIEGLELNDQISPELIGLTSEDALYFAGPLDVHAQINRVENTVLANTRVRGSYISVCARCLIEVKKDWDFDFLLDYSVGLETDTIELDEDIRQEVILNLPVQVLCKSGCKGICPKCGVDLNSEQCQCVS